MQILNFAKRVLTIILITLMAKCGPSLKPNFVSAQSAPNLIIVENQLQGSDDWQLTVGGYRVSDEKHGQILGYADAPSINKGETIGFKVSVSPVQSFTMNIFRMGWYGGKGARLVDTVEILNGIHQKDCPLDLITGLTECQWETTYSLTVPKTWVSGIYLVVLKNAEKYRSHIAFVVRDDNRIANFIYQQPIFTYAAYNNFPNNLVNGKSLYDSNSYGNKTISGTPRAVKVSLNRPDSTSDFSGASYNSEFGYWEIYTVQWLEHIGYDVVYSTDVDTHMHGEHLLKYRGVIVPGHSEYWTSQMFDAFERARDSGVSIAFLGANAVYWHVRLEPSTAEQSNRTIVSYKSAETDPDQNPAQKTILFRDIGRPEQKLIGIQWVGYQDSGRNADIVPLEVDHWAFNATGLSRDRHIEGLVGNEVDHFFSEVSGPISQTYAVLASSPFTTSDNVLIYAETTIYQAPSGAWIFAAGTMCWGWGLGRPGFENLGIKQLTLNVLDRFAGIVRTNSAVTPMDDTSQTTLKSSDLSHTSIDNNYVVASKKNLEDFYKVSISDLLVIAVVLILVAYCVYRIRRHFAQTKKLRAAKRKLKKKS